jgi:hypothetical protein
LKRLKAAPGDGYIDKVLAENLVIFAKDLISRFLPSFYIPHAHLLLSNSIVCEVLESQLVFKIVDFEGRQTLHY